MKRFLSAFICVIMIFSMLPSALAATDTSNYDEANAILLSKTLKIMVGDEDGNMRLDDFVSRAEFTKIAITMSAYRNMVPPNSTTSFFKDCNFKHWAAPYVRLAVTNGLITGYPDGTFRPENTVLLEEAVTVLLKLLGFTSEDFGSSWPYGQIGIATNQHVLDNVSCQVGAELSRRDVLKLVYNTLVAQPKDAQTVDTKYLQSLNCNVYEDAVLIATNKENDGVTPGYILTSAGTFKMGNDFNHGLIGRKGDLIVVNGNDYGAFMQSEQTMQKHVVYSMIDSTVITYSNGTMSSFDIDDGIDVYRDTTKTTFGEVRGSLTSGDTVYIMKNASGNVDYITLTTDNMAGPYTVSGKSQLSSYGIDTASAIVMRDGVKSSVDAIEANDVVYYLGDINTVFAYSRKITGVYEKATPNRDMPSSVTVSGKEYTIESAAAFDKLSSNGSTKYGDTVTLLLGKDGEIADVITDTAKLSETIAGYLVGTGTKEYTNANGEPYTAMYATLIKPDGSELEVVTDRNYDGFISSIMEVEYTDGIAKLSKSRKDNNVSGDVSAKNMKIGSDLVDDNVEILDVTSNSSSIKGSYVRTYMRRLDGVNIPSSRVLYSNVNISGKVDKLILYDVTGDAYSYGIVTDVQNKSVTTYTKAGEHKGVFGYNELINKYFPMDGGGYNMKLTHTKTCTINVNGDIYTSNDGIASAIVGSPVGISLSGTDVNSMEKVTSAGTVKRVGDGTVTIGNTAYLTSDNLVVYKSNLSFGISTYTTLPLSEIKGNEDKYTITAYWDKHVNSGGRVRLLIVKEK